MMLTLLTTVAWAIVYVPSALADSNDWVNIHYVTGLSPSSATRDAQEKIVKSAYNTGRKGPWSVTNVDVLPPSQDPHDYLSWAPYHWPDCNWCNGGNQRIAPESGSSAIGAPASSPTSSDDGDSPSEDEDPYAEEIALDPHPTMYFVNMANGSIIIEQSSVSPGSNRDFVGVDMNALGQATSSQSADYPSSSFLPSSLSPTSLAAAPTTMSASDLTSQARPPPMTSPTSYRTIDGSPTAAQDPAHTSKSKCTPSPTKSMALSATWTTCPYVTRDGKTNPDVRTLRGPTAINDASQSILYNAIAYALTRQTYYSQSVASFLDTFFLDSDTKMNPNLNFGQVVRGPDASGQEGTFTGILDLRGVVKIVNAVLILRGTGSSDWTYDRDQGLLQWSKTYASWLGSAPVATKAASRPNNHGTFFYSQFVSVQILQGDLSGARTSLDYYFTHQFKDQIAKSGEQPFEAVRTRPYHYRCFNLEAMITNAKLGDQLGVNYWTTKSKYGTTIQDALDYTMKLNPKTEKIDDIFPHVASVAAAYGDPGGKYEAFLRQHDASYQSQPFWYYDQTAALPNSPAAQSSASHRRQAPGTDEADFSCPEIFSVEPQVEIADGIFVTCDDLKPLYELTSSNATVT